MLIIVNNTNMETSGYSIIKTWCSGDAQALKSLRTSFDAECKKFQEFTQHKSEQPYVMGGFAALGNPSSFHNPFVRQLREWCMAEVLKSGVIRAPSKSHKFEQIIDRMMLRRQGSVPSKESWHRDEAPLAKPNDVLYGGWINLDDTPQYFSCIPGSHTVKRGPGGGFVKVMKEKSKEYDKSKPPPVLINPGDIIVFHENILHEVLSNKSKTDMYRVFLGWRVTTEDTPLIPGLDARLDNQSVMPLKSNQTPPMYAKLHWTNHVDKLVTFSKALDPRCLEIKTMKSGKRSGEEFTVVKRDLPSLKELGMTLYPAYNTRERKLYKPRKQWILRIPGKSRLMKTYTFD